MSANMNESEFKEKAFELFNGLRKRANSLKEKEGFIEEISKLIDDAQSSLGSGDIKTSLKKYYEAQGRINSKVNPLAWKLFYMEIGYLVILLILGFITCRWTDFIFCYGDIEMHLQAVWFGTLGGVTIAIYGLYFHIQERDFDPAYQLWYICKPIIGGIFGWFVYVIYYIGLISVQGIQDVKVQIPLFPFALAFLAGFSERFTIKMIDRLMAVFLTPGGENQGKAKTTS